GKPPIEHIIREFQISASAAFVPMAKSPVIGDQQLQLRDFKDLKRTANANPYRGPISGRANRETRDLIAPCRASGLRCPLIIPTFNGSDIEKSDERPVDHAVPTHADVWLRNDVANQNQRMFVADFTRDDVGAGFTNKLLARLGRYSKYSGFGG